MSCELSHTEGTGDCAQATGEKLLCLLGSCWLARLTAAAILLVDRSDAVFVMRILYLMETRHEIMALWSLATSRCTPKCHSSASGGGINLPTRLTGTFY